MVERSAGGHSAWMVHLRADPVPWLLEPANPSARYLTLRHVLGRPEEDPHVVHARAGILQTEPAASILAAQWPAGYWVTPDRGYTPRYRSTVWQIAFLAQLGAPRDVRIEHACEFVWQHSRRDDGLFTPHKRPRLVDLVNLNGNLLWTLTHFGYAGDPRIGQVLDALAGLDLAQLFRAGDVAAVVKLSRGLQACSDGLNSVLRSFMSEAEKFLVKRLPPAPGNQRLELRFPLAEQTDLLEMLIILSGMGVVDDSRLTAAIELIVSGQDQSGRWPIEAIPGKMWASFGELGCVNKWVTVRALRALRALSGVE